ncbi:alpha/beta fold hydrolase [Halovulum sp. GXIMD14793]
MADQNAPQTIVFLHGAGVDRTLWEPQISAFSPDFQVIAPDLPGHGVVPAVTSVEAMAEAVHQTLVAADAKRYALVGLSLGGMVALEMVRRWPEEVSHLVLMESVPNVTESRRVRAFGHWALGILGFIRPSWLTILPARSMGAETADAGCYVKAAIRRMQARNARDIMRAALAYDGRGGLVNIAVPTLIMVGEKNPATHAGAKLMAAQIPDSRFEEVANAGHILNRDAPAHVNAAIRAHLERRSRPAPD